MHRIKKSLIFKALLISTSILSMDKNEFPTLNQPWSIDAGSGAFSSSSESGSEDETHTKKKSLNISDLACLPPRTQPLPIKQSDYDSLHKKDSLSVPDSFDAIFSGSTPMNAHNTSIGNSAIQVPKASRERVYSHETFLRMPSRENILQSNQSSVTAPPSPHLFSELAHPTDLNVKGSPSSIDTKKTEKLLSTQATDVLIVAQKTPSLKLLSGSPTQHSLQEESLTPKSEVRETPIAPPSSPVSSPRNSSFLPNVPQQLTVLMGQVAKEKIQLPAQCPYEVTATLTSEIPQIPITPPTSAPSSPRKTTTIKQPENSLTPTENKEVSQLMQQLTWKNGKRAMLTITGFITLLYYLNKLPASVSGKIDALLAHFITMVNPKDNAL